MLYYFELFNIPMWDNSKTKAVKSDTATEDDEDTFHKPKEGYKRNQSSTSSSNSSNKKSKNEKSYRETDKKTQS